MTDVAEGARRVAGGGSYVSKAVEEALRKGGPSKGLPSLTHPLTPLELKLVRKIAEVFTSREIAVSLDLSSRTVENYRTAICTKLDLSGPNALLRFALSQRNFFL